MDSLAGWFTTCVFYACSKHSFKAFQIPGRPGAGCSGALLISMGRQLRILRQRSCICTTWAGRQVGGKKGSWLHAQGKHQLERASLEWEQPRVPCADGRARRDVGVP